ncbi:MAG: hypothetical protein HYW79_03170 [Parcubacteria group bacterium]|nr:hypothetical protein [Parcubacteria group bacterium]
MSTKTLERVKAEIKRELMQEFVLPILREVKDAEGEYKEAFIRQVLKMAKEKPSYVYDPKTFLGQIKK